MTLEEAVPVLCCLKPAFAVSDTIWDKSVSYVIVHSELTLSLTLSAIKKKSYSLLSFWKKKKKRCLLKTVLKSWWIQTVWDYFIWCKIVPWNRNTYLVIWFYFNLPNFIWYSFYIPHLPLNNILKLFLYILHVEYIMVERIFAVQ